MYDYRRMTSEQRARVLAERRGRGVPWHGPPHFGGEDGVYLITAACFEHRDVLSSPKRLSEFSAAMIDGLEAALGTGARAWVVQPNHYHVLVQIDLDVLRPWLGRLHNGKATQWNREDGTPGRKVWHGFSDRRMRSERHYYATLNYIHANPVRHGYAEMATEWPWSSLHDYLETHGREILADWWRRYPVHDYGRGWDD